MKVSRLALRMLDEYELLGKYVNLSLSSHSADGLSGAERGALAALLYTVTEHKYTYDYYICAIAERSLSDIEVHTLNILRIGACRIIDMNSMPSFAAVNETVKLARGKGESGFVNALLRKMARLYEAGELPMPDRSRNEARYISVKHSFPLPLTKHFISLLGTEATESCFGYFNAHASTDITVNTAKISREELALRLTEDGYSVSLSPISELTVRIEGSCDPRGLYGFSDGLFLVQDTASAVSSLVLSPERGDRIIDVCAAPGGKSMAAGIISGGAEILALDLHESKLSLIDGTAKRLGIGSLRVDAQDARVPRTELFGTFDKLICDVPCSGLGVLGKKPDMRYRSIEDMEALPELQYEILSASVGYLKAGGVAVYSTCTLNPKENEDVVMRFLENNKDYSLSPFSVGGIRAEDGILTLYPHIHNTDGFFIARIVRRA